MSISTFLQDTQNTLNNASSCTLENADKGLCLQINNQHACASLSLFGGHLLSYMRKNDNIERLWVSNDALFDQKTPIRGGIPICWPWFSAHNTESSYHPSHGFARTQMWHLVSIEEKMLEQKVMLTRLVLQPTELDQYAYVGLKVKLVVEIGEQLQLSLVTINQSDKEIPLSQALHTYLRINNIEQTCIEGVTTPYDDKPSGARSVPAPANYKFIGETDRIHYLNHENYSKTQVIKVFNEHNSNQQLLHCVEQLGHDSTVVWNPGKEKSLTMKDMSENAHLQMLCIEAANTQNSPKPLILLPQQIHKLMQIIK